MTPIADTPLQVFFVDKFTYCFYGNSPENRRIVVDENIFSSLKKITKTFPELVHRPSILALCANFLMTGNEFRVVTDPIEFKKNYFPSDKDEIITRLGKVRFECMRMPHFEDNSFVFYAWHEVNDLPYRVTCIYPFVDSNQIGKYELFFPV